MKEYEHRRLVCEHECKVGEKYVLPQAQAFGLSWFNTKDRRYSLRCNEWCNQDTIGWRSPPDPTDKMMDDMGPVVVPAQALERMSGLDARTQPSARQGNDLQLNQTKKVQAE